MRLFSWLPLFFLLQYSVCGQQDPIEPAGTTEPGLLTVLAEELGGQPIEGVAITLAGLLQTETAPATFELSPGVLIAVSVAREGYEFSPADTSITLSEGRADTLRFRGAAAAQRIVLVEDFSNTGCVPCPAADEAMWAAVAAATGPAYPLAWHPNFPAPQDPFFLYNPVLGHYGNTGSRNSFYSISQLPHIRVDGVPVSVPSSESAIATLIAEKLALAASLELSVTRSEQGGQVTVSAQGRVLRAPAGGSWRIYLVLVETLVHFDAPNGQTEFRNTVRHVNGEAGGFGSPLGEPVSLAPGAEFGAQATFAPNFGAVAAENLRAVVFVQDSDSKLILDAAIEAPGGP